MEVTMSWTEITREQYRRDGLRYASDVNDAEWLLLSFFLPARCRIGGPRGFDAAKKIRGRKRHIVTDTQGFLLAVLVHAANVQDNHGAVPLLATLRKTFPKLRYVVADRVYRGKKLRKAIAAFGRWKIEIVTRTERTGSFKPEPKRWVVERTFAWLGRNRRLAKDFERTIASAEAWFL